MPQSLPSDPAVLQALLASRGLAAQNGVLRVAPLASPPSSNGVSGGASVPPVTGASPTPSNGAPANGPIENADGSLTDPTTGKSITPQEAQSIWPDWVPIVAGATGAAAGYAASALRNRKGVPTVEGQVVDEPERINNPTEEVGEYTNVSDPARIGNASQADTPPTSASVLADRQRRLTGPTRTLPKPAPGKYADIDAATMKRAQAIADALVSSRVVGNSAPALAAKRGASTGALNRENLLEGVIAAIRKAGISNVAKAIP